MGYLDLEEEEEDEQEGPLAVAVSRQSPHFSSGRYSLGNVS